MKRVLATGMALAMLVSAMTVGAGAAYSTEGANNFNTDDAQNTSKAGQVAGGGGEGVDGELVGSKDLPIYLKTGDAGDVTHVYAVSYEVGDLTFTYGNAAGKIWNPVTLQYETVTPEDPSTLWTTDTRTITVTNYSDLKVKVEASVSLTKENGKVTIIPDPNPLELASAAPENIAGTGTAVSGTITLTAAGNPVGVYEQATQIGTVTLTVYNNEKTPAP